MVKARTRKKPKTTVLTFDDLFGEDKGAPYTGPVYLDPDFRASKMRAFPVRKRSKVIVTTRTFKEMPNGDLIMEVTRRTEPAPKGNTIPFTDIDPADIRVYTDRSGRLHVGDRNRLAGKRARPKKPARA